MSSRALKNFNLLLYSVLCLCFIDVVFYNSYYFIFFSLLIVFTLLILYFYLSITPNVENSLTFLILTISFYSFTIAPYSKYLEEGAFFVLGPLIFFALAIIFSGTKKSENLINFTFFDKILITLTFLTLLLSNSLFNPEELSEPQGILKMICMGGGMILFSYYFSNYLYKNENILISFLKLILYIGILTAIYGILTLFSISFNPVNEYGYAISFFKHPNATPSMYSFSIPITVWFLIFRYDKINVLEKIIFTSGLILSLVALLFTFSRFSIITIFISILILVYNYSKKLFFTVSIVSLISSTFVIANFFSTKGSATILGRIGLLETTFEMFNDTTKFLFGYGSVSTRIVFEKIKFMLGVTDPNNNPHNIILFAVLLHGIIFAAALFTLFFKYFFKSVKSFFKGRVSDIFLLSLSICSGLFLKNMAEDLLFFPEFFMWYLFLTFFGFLVIEETKSTPNINNN